ncbi:SPT3 dosage dependent suppressor of Ty-induced promoter mutations-like protein [Scheffersomyces xylosifermentans]|uniref:SPT3 dosage dependent suppressor of Ty-induced promoter mutations-like protein n=1 Tax=Scheffersomyces xylosifermentans TaxID=1304137 RepID=UPI00315D9B54
MTSSMDDPLLEQHFLNSIPHDDQDLLDEFLDQRVYDSLGTTTPVGGVKMEQGDLLENFYHPVEAAVNQRSQFDSNTPNNSNGNEYLYIDQLNYQNSSNNNDVNSNGNDLPSDGNSLNVNSTHNNSVYASPLEHKSLISNDSNESPSSMNNRSILAGLQNNGQNNNDDEMLVDQNNNSNSVNQGNSPSNLSPLTDYDFLRDELAKLKFGNHNMNPCPPSVDVPDPSYLDFSPETLAALPYTLQLSNLPHYSRVETQIKLKFSLSPPPPHVLLHIPQDLISKNKFCLNESISELSPKIKENLLFLDAYVLTSDLKKSCNICPRCIKREQKRASRRKAGFNLNEIGEDTLSSTANNSTNAASLYNSPVSVGTTASGVVKNNPNSWADEKMMKKALIFNCKEIVSFPPPSGLNNDPTKSLELSARIICYCRHHKESEGFKLLFVVTNSEGEVVAKQLSSAIMIMDRKKNTSSVRNESSMPNSIAGSSTNLHGMTASVAGSSTNLHGLTNSSTNLHGLSGLSDAYDSSRPGYKKKKTHSDSDGDGKSPLGTNLHPLSPNSIDESASEPQTNTDTNIDGNGRGLKRKKLSIDDSYNSSTNPMFNGSVNGFSPLSNSDTNTSTTNHNGHGSVIGGSISGAGSHMMMKTAPTFSLSPLTTQAQTQTAQQLQLQQQQSQLQQSSISSASSNSGNQNLPSIQRIIPAQGPIRGGIEVTLLGFNFRPGLSVKFGANQALATHCWSETTIVTYLPPAAQPGQVLVSFENHENAMLGGPQQQQIFTYTDDTDRQLIELALQIVGLKMNGKLEDAKNIAKRIVGTDSSTGGAFNGTANTSTSPHQNSSGTGLNDKDESNVLNSNLNSSTAFEWFDSAHRKVQQLTKSDLSTEDILISFLSLVDLPNCPIVIPNWQLGNKQGQSLLHLATLKNYTQLIRFLITHGCKIDLVDNQGLTPLFLASMCGHRDLINIFIDCKSNWNLKLSNDKYLKDYCDLNVLDVFNSLQEREHENDDFGRAMVQGERGHDNDDKLNKSVSLDSLNSMFTMNYGKHVSKMVMQEPLSGNNDYEHFNSFNSEYNHDGNRELRDEDIYAVRKELFSPVNSPPPNLEDSASEFADSEFESNEDEYDDDGYLIDDEEDDDDYYDEYEDDDDESDYYNNDADVEEEEVTDDAQSFSSNSTLVPGSTLSDGTEVPSSASALWQKVKNVFNNDEEDNLPSYDDLFPFGQSSLQSKPKTHIERTLNEETTVGSSSRSLLTSEKVDVEVTKDLEDPQDDAGIASDSSEDMVISYINHPRKAVENDKMLLFFWVPVLIGILALFFMISVMGYRFETIEFIKVYIRDTIGQLMVGNERIGRVFKTNGENVLHATRRLTNELI